jgi:hypothetical protein
VTDDGNPLGGELRFGPGFSLPDVATVPKEKMTDKTITPERLNQLEATSRNGHSRTAVDVLELRELLRVYRAHLAQPEPDRSGEPQIVARLRDLAGSEGSVTYGPSAAQEIVAWLDRRPAAETSAHGGNECPRRETIRRAEAETAEQAAKVRTCEARIAELESERDQAWENRNMLRSELDAVNALTRQELDRLRSELSASRAETEAMRVRICTIADEANGPHPVQTAEAAMTCIEEALGSEHRERERLRAEVLRLNELGKKERAEGEEKSSANAHEAAHFRRAFNGTRELLERAEKELQAERAKVARALHLAELLWGYFAECKANGTPLSHGTVENNLMQLRQALRPSAPKEAEEHAGQREDYRRQAEAFNAKGGRLCGDCAESRAAALVSLAGPGWGCGECVRGCVWFIEQPEPGSPPHWRTGRSQSKTIYREDKLVAVVVTDEHGLAAEMVSTLNRCSVPPGTQE